MSARSILIILSIISFVSLSVGSYSVITTLKNNYINETHKTLEKTKRIVAHGLETLLGEKRASAMILAGLPPIKNLLIEKNSWGQILPY